MKKIWIALAVIIIAVICLSGCELTNPEVMENFSATNKDFGEAKTAFSQRALSLIQDKGLDQSVKESFEADMDMFKQAEGKEAIYYLVLGTYDYESDEDRSIMVTKLDDERYSITDTSSSPQKDVTIKTVEKSSYMTIEENGLLEFILEKSVIEHESDGETIVKYAMQFTKNNYDGSYDILQLVIQGDEGRMAIFENETNIFSSIYKSDPASSFATNGDRNYQVTQDDFIYNID
ncbi:MAG: hypothetical protein WBM21_05915 [Christensenellales bacterium]